MSDIPAAFAFLHKRNKRDFGTTFKVWWPTVAKGTAYTVEIACAAGAVATKGAALLGFVTSPMDGIVIHATAADFPFEPRPNQEFIYGATAATGKKYRILTAAKAEGNHAHYRITAERA